MRWDGERYQARFDALAADGVDVHGEAAFVRRMRPSGVLDAGCGTGRVAIELARHGIDVVGVDLDESMLARARAAAPDLDWRVADLIELDLRREFDVVLMAGNVPLFTEPGTNAAVIAACARHVAPGGALVAGFQLGRGFDLADYDRHAVAAGLTLVERWSTWERAPFDAATADYAVSIHRPGTEH